MRVDYFHCHVDSNGKSVDTRSLTTSGAPAAIRLSADRTALNADGGDIAFVTVEVVCITDEVIWNTNVISPIWPKVRL